MVNSNTFLISDLNLNLNLIKMKHFPCINWQKRKYKSDLVANAKKEKKFLDDNIVIKHSQNRI